jgi:2-keto-3-deoxy-L-rhamnonate aldolase RhmA
MATRIQDFRRRLTAREPLIGTFLKTPEPVICELLSRASLDVVCLDVEHAPFGRLEIDHCIAALRAADQPSLVRVGSSTAADIRNALDCGATGIVVPHVNSEQQARSIVAAARFGEGGRGYSGTTRAADFGAKPMREYLHDSHTQTAIVVQIEDLAALESVAAIAAVDGIDCVFVGRIDLAVAMGKEPLAPEVVEVVVGICAAGQRGDAAVGMFTPNMSEIARWRAAGASLFLLGSDHGFVLSGARELAAMFHDHSQANR